jgi:hypothetical protein
MKKENNFATDLLADITKKAKADEKKVTTKKTTKKVEKVVDPKVALKKEIDTHLEAVKSKLFEVIKVPLAADVQAIVLPEVPVLPEQKHFEFLNKKAKTKGKDVESPENLTLIKKIKLAKEEAEKLLNVKALIVKIKLEINKILKLKKAEENKDIFFLPPVGKFGIYKTVGGSPLGIMGNDFTPMQPIEFFDSIVATVQEFGADLDLRTLKFKQFCNGSKIEFSLKMFPLSFKNNKGLKDITNLELTFSTSYDGSKSNVITLYTERLICLNGMVAKGIEGYIKGRNTLGGKTKVLTFVEEIAYIINSGAEFRKQMIELDKKPVTKEQIEMFKLKLFGYNRETLNNDVNKDGEINANTFKHNFLDIAEEAFEEEFKRTGETLFGLLQGATNYSNHYAQRSEQISQDEYIRFFQGAKINDKAQELVLEMAMA